MSPIVVMFRWGGLGDVLMAMAASQAVKIQRQAKIILITQPAYHEIARLCPSVDAVVGSLDELKCLAESPTGQNWLEAANWQAPQVFNFNSVSFGLDPVHQVDAYLRAMGLEAPPVQKCLLLDLPANALSEAEAALVRGGWDPSRRPVLIHAAKGDPNRTWPKENWEKLVQSIQAEGHFVALIGSTHADPGRGVHSLDLLNALDLVNGLSLPGLVALMRRSALLLRLA